MKLSVILVFLWLSLAFLVRFVGLDKSPISINFDEAGLGYNAYSLMLTQKDEFGVKWPLALRSFNDFKPALYSYLTIPFIKVMDLNQTSTRLVSALFGTISLIFFFLILRQITGISTLAALLISIFISFLPWRLHYSRIAFESNLSMCFFTAMFWSLINLSKNRIYHILAIIFALLSIYSYHGARLAVPVLFILLILDPLSQKLKKLKNLWPLLIIILFSVPIFISNNSSSVLRRLDQTNVFTRFYPYTPKELIKDTNPWLSLTNNPLYYLTGIITGHVLSYLSPRNLAVSIYHWVTKSPQGISGTGMFGWLAALFFICGIYQWFKQINIDQKYRYLLYWLLAAVSPVAVTYEWFHPLRSLNGFPALEIICGFGIIYVFKKINKILLLILIGIMFTSSVYNLNNELNYAIYDTNGEFQPGGYKEGAALLNSLKDKYQTVYLDSPHAQNYVMFLFYMKYPPQNIQKYAVTRPPMGTEGFLNFNFDNFVYRKYNWLEQKYDHNFVIWTSAEVLENEINETPGAKLHKIYDPLNRWVASIITKE